jgi:peroxiredoxin
MTKRISFTLLLGFLALSLSSCESAPEGKRVGNQCPQIAGDDIDGKPIKLTDFRGKVVLVNFWGTWCPPCRKLIPHEKEMMLRQYKGRPFTILGVAQDSPEALRDFMINDPLPWPNIVDSSKSISDPWQIDVVPSMMLVDQNGVIRRRWFDGVEPEKVWEAVEQAVKEVEKQ